MHDFCFGGKFFIQTFFEKNVRFFQKIFRFVVFRAVVSCRLCVIIMFSCSIVTTMVVSIVSEKIPANIFKVSLNFSADFGSALAHFPRLHHQAQRISNSSAWQRTPTTTRMACRRALGVVECGRHNFSSPVSGFVGWLCGLGDQGRADTEPVGWAAVTGCTCGHCV